MDIHFYAYAPAPLVGRYVPKIKAPRFPTSYYIHCPDTQKGFLLLSYLPDSSMDDHKRGKAWLLHEDRSYPNDAPHQGGERPFVPGNEPNTARIYGARYARVNHPTWMPNGVLAFLSTPEDNMAEIRATHLTFPLKP